MRAALSVSSRMPVPGRPGADRRLVGSVSSATSSLLAGGLALLGLAAVPVAGIVADSTGAVPAPTGPGPGSTTPVVPAPAELDDHGPAVLDSGMETPKDVRTAAAGTAPDDEVVTTEPAGTDESSASPVATDDGNDPAGHHDGDHSAPDTTVWDRLADCESGDRDTEGRPLPGTARWDYGLEFTHEGYERFEGGLNFDPATWDDFRDADMPGHAGHATREQEITIGERVLAAQGWGAWPVCSEMIGRS